MSAVKLNNSQLSALKEAFALYDYQKNATISTRDIAQVIRSIGLKPTEAEIREIRNEIEAQDVFTDMQTLVSLISRKVTEPKRKPIDDYRQIFHGYDTNRNGKILLSDMSHLMTNLGERLTEAELSKLLQSTDSIVGKHVDYERFLNKIMKT